MFGRQNVLVAATIALTSVALSAHDLWIEPTTYFPESGRLVSLRLRVGQDFIGDPLPRDPQLVKQFIFDDGQGQSPVMGRSGADPAGLLRITRPGTIVVGYHSHPSRVEQTADKFNQYLQEEGLEAIAALRAARKEGNTGARELFSRCAKTLLSSGPQAQAQGDKLLGCTLELLAERNPYTASIDQDVPFLLRFEGRPLPGTLVVAMSRRHPDDKQRARTDKEGRVRFRLLQSGPWLIKAVHMVPAPVGSDAEWVSFWSSLTFERPTPP